ncbi:MAG TPA: PilZ domain-containing protein [Sphingomicrobium sp.]|nr:PilZ domain-containing protein [Sphingomicrobium sp.]
MTIRAEIFGGPEERKTRLLVRKKPKQAEVTALTDVVIAREESRRTDMRHEDRPLAERKALQVTFRSRRHHALVVNLSGGGAMIAAKFTPNIGERIHLHLAENDVIECVVRWVKDEHLGLEFAHETKLDCNEEKKETVLRDAVSRMPCEIAMLPVAPEPANDRSADRHPLIWSGQLRSGQHTCPVRLRNISSTGALVQCDRSLRDGADVILDLGDGCDLPAKVRWVVGDLAGLQFAEPFELEQLSMCKPRVMSHTWVRPAYLESDVSAESAWDGPWNRMSLNELRAQLEGFLKH